MSPEQDQEAYNYSRSQIEALKKSVILVRFYIYLYSPKEKTGEN